MIEDLRTLVTYIAAVHAVVAVGLHALQPFCMFFYFTHVSTCPAVLICRVWVSMITCVDRSIASRRKMFVVHTSLSAG
jgi:hypothetical protein